MHWGHVKSQNLVDWHHLPVALAPSEIYDADGRRTIQVQCLVISADGAQFEKSDANPVLATNPLGKSVQDFRDPKVWSFDGHWYMVVGSKGDRGTILLFRSIDLVNWRYVGVVAEGDEVSEEIWECPDLFDLGGRHILLVSPAGVDHHTNRYIMGELDYATGRLTQETIGQLDLGRHFYARKRFCHPTAAESCLPG